MYLNTIARNTCTEWMIGNTTSAVRTLKSHDEKRYRVYSFARDIDQDRIGKTRID